MSRKAARGARAAPASGPDGGNRSLLGEMSQSVRTARPPPAGPALDPPGGGNGAVRRRREGGETGRNARGPRLTCLVALGPGALAVYLGFNAGGFFAGSTAVAA